MSEHLCPWCGARALDITLSEDRAPKYLCIGPEAHRWGAGEGPALPEPEREGIGLEDIAEAVAARVKDKLEKPSLFKRFFSRS